MRPLPNFNFAKLDTYTLALAEVECQIRLLKDIVDECGDTFTDEDRYQLVSNIKWLKRFYEAAERCVINGD
jgi:hypothetical protein